MAPSALLASTHGGRSHFKLRLPLLDTDFTIRVSELRDPKRLSVGDSDLAELDRAIADSQTQGFVKVLTVPGKDTILGVTIVGSQAGELLAEYVLAMKHGLGLNKILGTIHTYPTMAEANKYAAGEWKRAHAPQKLLAWVKKFHDWRRG